MKKSLIVFAATVFATTSTPSLANTDASAKVSKGTAGEMRGTMPVSDAKMAQDVRETLQKDQSLSSQARNLRVSSSNGAVTVSGTVGSEVERSKVEAIARQVAGSQDKVVMDVAVE